MSSHALIAQLSWGAGSPTRQPRWGAVATPTTCTFAAVGCSAVLATVICLVCRHARLPDSLDSKTPPTLLIEDFERDLLPVLLASNRRERAHRLYRASLASDQLPHIRRRHRHFDERRSLTFGFRHRYSLR